jgi:hypothetical protein
MGMGLAGGRSLIPPGQLPQLNLALFGFRSLQFSFLQWWYSQPLASRILGLPDMIRPGQPVLNRHSN